MVECSNHGSREPAFLCRHLMENSRQAWFCAHPTADNLWPNAWCSSCDIEFLKEGEWNEKNEHVIEAGLVCSECYEAKRADSSDILSGETLAHWQHYVAACCEKMKASQSKLWEEYQLGGYSRWDWEQSSGELVFSDQDGPKVIAKIEFIGSVSTTSKTWLWAWANFHILESVRSKIIAVRDFGEKNGYPKLVVPKWPADEIDGWNMAVIAADVLGARGVYRTPGEEGFTFLALMDVRNA